jgi:hypothetical protein
MAENYFVDWGVNDFSASPNFRGSGCTQIDVVIVAGLYAVLCLVMCCRPIV